MKMVISIIVVVAVVLVGAFVPLVEVPLTVEHRHTETVYEDGEPMEKLVIRYETQRATVTLVEYLRLRFQD